MKIKRERLEPEAVLSWLSEHHPQLLPDIEQDRNWLWISGDQLKPCNRGCKCAGCEAKAQIRGQLMEIGFRYAPSGHELPSGRIAHWANACVSPIPFRRRDGKTNNENKPTNRTTEPEPDWLSAATAFINS